VIKRPETAIVKLAAVLCAGAEESLTFTVKLKLPAVVGVPEITPAELRERPGGRDPPATHHL
jgi:hypothetical protein